MRRMESEDRRRKARHPANRDPLKYSRLENGAPQKKEEPEASGKLVLREEPLLAGKIEVKQELEPLDTRYKHPEYRPCAVQLMVSRCLGCGKAHSHHTDTVQYNLLRRDVGWRKGLVRVVVRLDDFGAYALGNALARVVAKLHALGAHAVAQEIENVLRNEWAAREVVMFEAMNWDAEGARLRAAFAETPTVVVVNVAAALPRDPKWKLLLATVAPCAPQVAGESARLAREKRLLPQYAQNAPLYAVKTWVAGRALRVLQDELVDLVLQCEPKLHLQNAANPDVSLEGPPDLRVWE